MKKLLIILILSFGYIGSCDNTVNPVDEDTGLYSVYGVLELGKSRNVIRIRDLKAPFTLEDTEKIDAEVTLENLETNVVETLTRERFRQNGVYHHNFIVQNILPDTGYELKIVRSDGRSRKLRIRTPSITTKSISPANRDCKTQLEVEFGNINGGLIEYVLKPDIIDPMRGDFFRIFYSFVRAVVDSDVNNPRSPLTTTFKPIEYSPDLNPEIECNELGIDKLYITYVYYSEGLQEKLNNPDFDPLESIELFGAVYVDTLVIPFDTSSSAKGG